MEVLAAQPAVSTELYVPRTIVVPDALVGGLPLILDVYGAYSDDRRDGLGLDNPQGLTVSHEPGFLERPWLDAVHMAQHLPAESAAVGRMDVSFAVTRWPFANTISDKAEIAAAKDRALRSMMASGHLLVKHSYSMGTEVANMQINESGDQPPDAHYLSAGPVSELDFDVEALMNFFKEVRYLPNFGSKELAPPVAKFLLSAAGFLAWSAVTRPRGLLTEIADARRYATPDAAIAASKIPDMPMVVMYHDDDGIVNAPGSAQALEDGGIDAEVLSMPGSHISPLFAAAVRKLLRQDFTLLRDGQSSPVSAIAN